MNRGNARTSFARLRAAGLPEDTPSVDDPMADMRRVAGHLVRAYLADPGNASLAREARMTLQALMGPGETVDGELAELFAAFRR